jgi:hypothetical protein
MSEALVVAHLNIVSWLFSLAWLWHRPNRTVYYLTCPRLTGKLIANHSRFVRLGLEMFPGSLVDVHKLAIQMCEETWEDMVKASALALVQRAYAELDLTAAIKRGLVLWFYLNKASLAVFASILADSNHVTLWASQDFSMRLRGRNPISTAMPWGIRLSNWLGAWKRLAEANARLLIKTALFVRWHGLTRHVTPSPDVKGRFVYRGHHPSFVIRGIPMLMEGEEPLTASEIVYLATYPLTQDCRVELSRRGAPVLEYVHWPIPIRTIGFRMARDLVHWFTGPVWLPRRCVSGQLNWIASILLVHLWDESLLTSLLSDCVVGGSDDTSVAHAIRTEMLRRNGSMHIQTRQHVWTMNANLAYLHCDAYLLMGEAFLPLLEEIRADIRHYPIIGEWSNDFLHEVRQLPLPPELAALRDRFKLVVAYSSHSSPVFENVGVTQPAVRRFNAVMLDYLEHNPRAFVLFKLHPGECTNGCLPSVYQDLSHARLKIVGEDYDPYVLMTAADLVLATFSEAGLEAFGSGTPAFYLNLTGSPASSTSLSILAQADGLVLEDENTFNAAFDRALETGRTMSDEARQQIVERYAFRFDGHTRQRLHQVIREFMAQVGAACGTRPTP